jgi:predicted naringenin-chalcone synthase
MTAVYLNQFEVIRPKNRVKQDDLLEWLIKCHQCAEENKNEVAAAETVMAPQLLQRLFQRYSVKATQISTRYFESDDMLTLDFSDKEIYLINKEHKNGRNITERTHFFSTKAYDVFKKFYPLEKKHLRPDHLIHVSCTGYISPSAPQRIVSEKEWDRRTDITHAYHMGCYASLPAIRLASALVKSEFESNNKYRTDIIHNELCGLHMNALMQTPEQMVLQTLFADGHIKYTASASMAGTGHNLKVLAVMEKIIHDSQEDMSWVPAPWGMQMNLSREVPSKIKPEIKQFSSELFKRANLTEAEGLNSLYAIHPGGPKIIDAVAEVLELKSEQTAESKKVLFERGNMSSATLPHVWTEILNNQYPVGTKVISFAFGPGLTLFGSVLEVC